MDKEEFESLKNDEIEWIAKKERAVKEASIENEGGSIVPIIASSVAASYTQERVYYLISLIEVRYNEKANILPDDIPETFYFSSGVGGWATELCLAKDGTFTGKYWDSDMGDIGEGYPNGILYTSQFGGKFKNIKKINDYTYSMILDNIQYKDEIGSDWIEDGVLHIASGAYGFENGYEFLIYTPNAPKSELSEDFLSWKIIKNEENSLGTYGIYNIEEGYGFFN